MTLGKTDTDPEEEGGEGGERATASRQLSSWIPVRLRQA